MAPHEAHTIRATEHILPATLTEAVITYHVIHQPTRAAQLRRLVEESTRLGLSSDRVRLLASRLHLHCDCLQPSCEVCRTLTGHP